MSAAETVHEGDARSSRLDIALKGSLPCVRCGYELQGLSVRGACPECGTAIRATILYAVDPHAAALQSLPHAMVTAIGLVCWAGAAFVAALAGWAPRIADLLRALSIQPGASAWRLPAWIVVCAAAASGAAAAVALVRPTRETDSRRAIWAMLGVIFYGMLVLLLWRLYFVVDANLASTAYLGAVVSIERILYRLGVGACLAGIILTLRPNARSLVVRSLVLRTGRVSRQTMLVTLAVVGMTAIGDIVRMASILFRQPVNQVVDAIGVLLVVVGSLLLTLALGGVLVDSVRIARSLCSPAPSLKRVLHGEEHEEPQS